MARGNTFSHHWFPGQTYGSGDPSRFHHDEETGKKKKEKSKRKLKKELKKYLKELKKQELLFRQERVEGKVNIKFDFPETLCPFGYRGGPMGTGNLVSVGSMTCGECKSYSGITSGVVSCTYDLPLHICDNAKECKKDCKDGRFQRHDVPHYKHYMHCISRTWCRGKCVPITDKETNKKNKEKR